MANGSRRKRQIGANGASIRLEEINSMSAEKSAKVNAVEGEWPPLTKCRQRRNNIGVVYLFPSKQILLPE